MTTTDTAPGRGALTVPGAREARQPAAQASVISLRPDSDEVTRGDVAQRFASREHRSEARYVLPQFVPPVQIVPPGFDLVRDSRSAHHVRAFYELADRATLLITSSRAETFVSITGADASEVAFVWESTRALAAARLAADRVFVTLWSSTVQGSARREQLHVARDWQAMRVNYVAGARQQLDALMAMRSAGDADGRLLLWHGPPGTGKTTAVNALLSSWSSWCDAHVVTDPEKFFASPDYVMEIASEGGRVRLDSPMPSLTEPLPPRWKLIVCEDADEYLRSDARQRSGPALGRLLNLTDGLIGQGSDTLVLLTTNDEVGRLHPAVTRPGRCLAAVEFPKLTPDEAREWCHGEVILPQRSLSLAELYALRDGRSVSDHADSDGLYL